MKRKKITKYLPFDILSEVLQANNRSKLIVSGIMDKNKETITFCNGNGENFTVPFSFFKPNAVVSPDFDKFRIIDYGQTIAFGKYEAASDCIVP